MCFQIDDSSAVNGERDQPQTAATTPTDTAVNRQSEGNAKSIEVISSISLPLILVPTEESATALTEQVGNGNGYNDAFIDLTEDDGEKKMAVGVAGPSGVVPKTRKRKGRQPKSAEYGKKVKNTEPKKKPPQKKRKTLDSSEALITDSMYAVLETATAEV